MADLTLNTRISRNSQMITSNIDGEIVMMSIDNDEYYGLDEIGSRIWELLENPLTFESLIRILLDEFDVEEMKCKEDTREFLEQLVEKKLIIFG